MQTWKEPIFLLVRRSSLSKAKIEIRFLFELLYSEARLDYWLSFRSGQKFVLKEQFQKSPKISDVEFCRNLSPLTKYALAEIFVFLRVAELKVLTWCSIREQILSNNMFIVKKVAHYFPMFHSFLQQATDKLFLRKNRQ